MSNNDLEQELLAKAGVIDTSVLEDQAMYTERKGFSRPGVIAILSAVVLTVAFSIGPLMLAFSRPNHEFTFFASGVEAMLVSSIGLIVTGLYAFGCIRYCLSKGYSGWLGFWIFLSHIPGFITMLLLPDLHELKLNRGVMLTAPDRAVV
jgi:hypothetical protein